MTERKAGKRKIRKERGESLGLGFCQLS